MLTYISVAVVLLIIGLLIGWFLSKNSSTSLFEDLQQQFSDVKSQLGHATDKINTISGELNQSNQDLAVTNSRLEGFQTSNHDLLENNLSFIKELETLRGVLGEAQQAKIKAETIFSNASATIAILENKEHLKEIELGKHRDDLATLRETNAGLEAKHVETIKRLQEQQLFIDQTNDKLKLAFSSLSAEALKNNNESFVTLAKSTLETQVTDAKGDLEKRQQAIDALVKPLTDSLEKFDGKVHELEKVRLQQHGQINQYILGIQQTTEKLQQETHSLVSALKTSHGRGRYGEIALRRVVEFAGMTEHCDFIEQVSVSDEEGTLRPDMIIKLPGQKTIVADSKVPLSAYMKAFETENEEERRLLFLQHAAAVKGHLRKLSAKAYWSQFTDSPDYVILYMQIESSFASALQSDPSLIEEGIKNKVVFATPTTLITLLRTVGFVWQQVSIADNIELIRDAGIELYNRTSVLLGHFASMGNSLKTAVIHYNNAVASVESRFVPQARKLYELGSAYTKKVLPELEQIEAVVREVIVIDKAEANLVQNGEKDNTGDKS